MSKLPLVIVNPASARGSTRGAWPKHASDLRTHFGAFNCAFTESETDAVRLAEDAAREGRKLIIACGGDGTISEVANGILRSGCEAILGILPSGTGGDFRRTLKIPTRAADAAQVLRNGKTRSIDVGRATYLDSKGDEASRFFLGVASFGMSAEVIARVKEDENSLLKIATPRIIGGKLSYAIATAKATFANPVTRVHVKLDDKTERRLSVVQFCIANARYFGGGMKIAPDALLDDGKFDVVVIDDIGALKILANGPQLYFGTHLSIKGVHHTHATSVNASPASKSERIQIEVDGELPGYLPAKFEILPRALRVKTV
ncbi:MAG TPA: diacylglycerol kinase family protein [Pyrinomonadaceae bacterium]|nr:diacylglycerol kinase family protein [Pyrinomonadaceae bacterium]